MTCPSWLALYNMAHSFIELHKAVIHVIMCRSESWTIKKAEHWGIDAFKLWCWRLLLSPLDSKKLKSVNPKENQNCISIGRIHAEAPVLWPPDVKSRLTGKASDAGKDWGQEEKETTEDEMVGWHHRLDGHELEQTMGDSEGQGSLACYCPWGRKESDTTERLSNNKLHRKG